MEYAYSMKLKKMVIKNYRSIKEIEISFSDNINILVGPNGSGKTNILDAINGCFEAFLLNRCSIDRSDFWFGKDGPIMMLALITHKAQKYNVDFKCQKTRQFTINFNNLSRFLGYYKYINTNRFFRDSMFSLMERRDDLRYKFDKRFDDTRDIYFSYFDMLLKSPYNLEDLSKVISNIYPDLKDIHVKIDTNNNQGELIAIISDYAVPMHLLASGIQQIILLVSEIYYSKDNLILIDEPGLHMNPQMVIALADLIKWSSKENNNQFILGAHSPALISTIKDKIIPLEYKKTDIGYTTCISEVIPNEFVYKSTLIPGD